MTHLLGHAAPLRINPEHAFHDTPRLIDGGKGAIATYGDSAGQGALLWLHGGFDTSRTWREVWPWFAAHGARQLAMDLPGHGASARWEGPYSVEAMAQAVLGALDGLGVARVICCGHSLGGMVAQQLARLAPERVAALVLMDTTYHTSARARDRALVMLARAYLSVAPVGHVARLSAAQLGQRRPDAGMHVARELRAHAGDHAHYMRLWRAVFGFNSAPWLYTLRCPSLIMVAGENGATRRQAALFIDRMADAELAVIARAGHMLHWDQPVAWCEALWSFVVRRGLEEVCIDAGSR